MAQGWHKAPPISWDEEKGQGDAYFAYHFGAQVAEVEVDDKTGQVQVTRVVAAHDVGRALNPEAVKGQICGGVTMGVGYAILEEVQIHEGLTSTRNFDEYSIPTSLDAPEITAIIVEDPTAHGPYGAKGTGEPPILPTAPAITNAIFSACGRRTRDLPASLERVLLGKQLAKYGSPRRRRTSRRGRR